MHTVAAVQMVSTPHVADNVATARRLVAQAAADGASVVLLPEYWPIMGLQDTDKVAVAERDGDGPLQECMAALAREHAVTLIGGTIPLAANEAGKVYNSTLVFDPRGARIARYDKIHLFGFTRGEETYDEARTIVDGADGRDLRGAVRPRRPVGLLRPALSRSCTAAMGACALIVVPAAFTYTTGQAHWEILLRARAIENQCYVLAAARAARIPTAGAPGATAC
jgi:predicted amidohydrolase